MLSLFGYNRANSMMIRKLGTLNKTPLSGAKDDLFDTVNEAFRVANTGKKGAVHIDLPKCSSTKENGVNKININNTNTINNKNNYFQYLFFFDMF